jgi:hypothetical protein
MTNVKPRTKKFFSSQGFHRVHWSAHPIGISGSSVSRCAVIAESRARVGVQSRVRSGCVVEEGTALERRAKIDLISLRIQKAESAWRKALFLGAKTEKKSF